MLRRYYRSRGFKVFTFSSNQMTSLWRWYTGNVGCRKARRGKD